MLLGSCVVVDIAMRLSYQQPRLGQPVEFNADGVGGLLKLFCQTTEIPLIPRDWKKLNQELNPRFGSD